MEAVCNKARWLISAFSTLRGSGAYIISRVKTALVCGGEVLLSFYLQASLQSQQLATVRRMLYWRVLLNWGLCGGDLGTVHRKSDLWTLGAFVGPHKNLWLVWSMRVVKASGLWYGRWRVRVRHRGADDSWVQVWSGAYANPVPSVSGPLEIHRGTACIDISLRLCLCVRDMHVRLSLQWMLAIMIYIRAW